MSKVESRKAMRVPRRAFTLVELLVVISILGLLAALAVPAVKNLGKANVVISASRQLLDDVGRTRQLAMSQRPKTIYMVFLPTNFWGNVSWFNALTAAQRDAVTNLLDKQLSGYTFVSLGAVGDQPGNHRWRYLAPWRALPEGTYVATAKFDKTTSGFFTITNHVTQDIYDVHGFVTNAIPFPTEDSPTNILPTVVFDYMGRLTPDGLHVATEPEYIPLARGGISPAINPTTHQLQLGPASVLESPAGNSTNAAYNLVAIDPLTGRATLLYQRVQ